MLKPIAVHNSTPGAPRAWYNSPDLDVVVWYSPEGDVRSVQMCYAVRGQEYALSWSRSNGYFHCLMDAAQSPSTNTSRLLSEISEDACVLRRLVMEQGAGLPLSLLQFLLQLLDAYNAGARRPGAGAPVHQR